MYCGRRSIAAVFAGFSLLCSLLLLSVRNAHRDFQLPNFAESAPSMHYTEAVGASRVMDRVPGRWCVAPMSPFTSEWISWSAMGAVESSSDQIDIRIDYSVVSASSSSRDPTTTEASMKGGRIETFDTGAKLNHCGAY